MVLCIMVIPCNVFLFFLFFEHLCIMVLCITVIPCNVYRLLGMLNHYTKLNQYTMWKYQVMYTDVWGCGSMMTHIC
jgi:hypothetical protein